MAQRALPERETRLGRPRGAVGRAPHAVVLVLPGGGRTGGTRRGAALAATVSAVPLARRLARTTSDDDPVITHIVHYRHGGRGADPSVGAGVGASASGAASGAGHGHGDGVSRVAAACAADAESAVAEVVRRYGDVPVCLVGTDIGALAALRTAGHEAVASVAALGPLLCEPADGAGAAPVDGGDEEPVQQLRGRHVLIVHGTNDTRCHPELSFRLAERAKKVNAQVCRFEVHTDGHGLRGYAAEVAALTQDFVLGTLCGGDLCRPLTDALAAPPPLGLRMPLASGFGKNLR
ncbi:alpha/beta hydrolase [Streptomyces spirodelae]|uniref:Alpha/beta hydrolase n=1 Tax=Streptomyces spirodelae TaxID=2812904 RepID=A0ABS3WVE8_9ACTN|nr:alpha/beta hydrolase [Streptomyces spirodelae]MBO8186831.1 alpha/beta hydrolase [Streptomyces spirodelae]